MRTAPPARVAAPRPPLPGRIAAARTIILAQSPVLFLLGLLYVTQSLVIAGLCLAGAAILLWGGIRIGTHTPVTARPSGGSQRTVPWDWTDCLIFVAAAFTASSLLVNIAVPAVDAVLHGEDQTVRTAVDSFVAQAAFYGGALFNIWVLAGLRRNATLQDIGWRRFSWWWIPLAVVLAAATIYVADELQALSQALLPSAQNTQCTAVRHEYGGFAALAIVVVCLLAPLSEETIFRGFIYGWLHRWSPAAVAIPLSGALFAAAHNVPLLLLPLFAVGCILAGVFQASRSLWPGALVHALFNLVGIVAILSASSC